MLKQMLDWLKRYIDFRTLPKLMEDEKAAGGFKQSLMIIALSQFISLIAFSISYAIGAATNAEMAADLPVLIRSSVILSLIGVFVFYVISGLFFAIARLLDGKGSFDSQSYVLAMVSLCNTAISFPFVALSMLPGNVGWAVQFIVSIIALYSLYAHYLAVRSVHELSGVKAAIVLAASLFAMMLFATMLQMSAGGF